MKKVTIAALLALLTFSAANAHTLFLSVYDNDDGTISVSGMYSTGSVAANTVVRLEGVDGKVLFEGKTDVDGELEIQKPTTPYTIVLDGGAGHVATEEGP